MTKRLIALTHAIIIGIVLLSPWFVAREYIVLLYLLYILQRITIKGCILSHWQLGHGQSFWEHYLKKRGISCTRTQIDILFDALLPLTIIGIARYIQH